MEDNNKDKQEPVPVVQPNDADTPIRSIRDSLEESARRYVEEMSKKTAKRQTYIEELKETIRINEAAIASDKLKAIELQNKCTLQEDKYETDKASQKIAIDKMKNMYAVTKLMKGHCSIQKQLSKDTEDMLPRVEHYLVSVERMVADASRKMALDRSQVEQETAIVKQQIKANTEMKTNWEIKHSKMQTEIASAVLQSTAAMQVMKSKLDKTLAVEALVKRDIEKGLEEEKEREGLLIQLRQKVKEAEIKYTKGKNDMAKEISDMENRHMENEREILSLQEQLLTEENVTKQAGAESSRLQEILLTMEDSIATERGDLENVTEQLESIKKEHDAVMAKQTLLTAERDSKKQKLQEVKADAEAKCEELKRSSEALSSRYWQELDEKAEWGKRETELAGRAEALRGQIQARALIAEEICQQRAEKMELVEAEEEATAVRKNEKEALTEQLKSKRAELQSLTETKNELERKVESVCDGNAETRKRNEKISADLAAMKSDSLKLEEKLRVTRKRKDELAKMEGKMLEEVAMLQETEAKLSRDLSTTMSDMAKVNEARDKEVWTLRQSIDKKKTKLAALRERDERISNSDINDATSALTDKQRQKLRENMAELELLQRNVEQQKLLLDGKGKYQSDLMESLQTVATNRAKIAQSNISNSNDVKLLRRKLAKAKALLSTQERSRPAHTPIQRPGTPASLAGRVLPARAPMPPPGAPAAGRVLPARAPMPPPRAAPPSRASDKPKSESELDFDFSDFD